MKYMLDTNICIYAIKHKPPEVIKNFLKHDPDDMCISSITYGELMHGVEKSQAVERNRVAITLFLSSISILQFDNYAAEEYGKVRADLERKGTPIGPMDMLIAGHARSEGLVLVTNNTRAVSYTHLYFHALRRWLHSPTNAVTDCFYAMFRFLSQTGR